MKTTKVMIFDSYEDDIYDIPESPDEFLSFWKSKLNLIPEEYRSTATIEYSAKSDYDVPYLVVELSYQRPENEEEKMRRIQAENKIRSDIRQRDLRQLAELKEKYGDV
jgi:hypothetical protein